jgi:hypothetical protein
MSLLSIATLIIQRKKPTAPQYRKVKVPYLLSVVFEGFVCLIYPVGLFISQG